MRHLDCLSINTVAGRDVEAEAGSGSGGSGHILMEAEARKICRLRLHIIQKSTL